MTQSTEAEGRLMAIEKLTAGDPDTQSADPIANNVERLRELFPEAFTEGRIDFDVLRQLLGDAVDDGDERYGLNWRGKRASRRLALTPSTGTLRPAPEESVDWETTQNLMIEGDNLEVLKLLRKSYAGKVKLIYIDPPYNTGKDFVYPDNYKDNIRNYLEITGQVGEGGAQTSNTETSGRFHTDWLSMMYPRLLLGRDLLREDGLLLVSIDDMEVANLRGVCDEVFGAANFVASMIWEKARKNDARLVSVGHEYLLMYARSLSTLRERKTTWREEKPGAREIWDRYVELRELHGADNKAIETAIASWFSGLPAKHPSKKWSRYKRIDANGPWRDRDISWPGGDGPRYEVLHPVTGEPCAVPEAGWRYSSPDEMQRQIKLGLVEFREDHTSAPFRKAHLRPVSLQDEPDTEFDSDADEEDLEELATQVRGTYFYKQSQVAVKYLRELMGTKVFDNPKDHVELARLFGYVTANDPDAIIVDFFAGSGSSAHAVADLNASDGGKRRYVLVQLPEPVDPEKRSQRNTAKYLTQAKLPLNLSELTKERLRRSAARIREEHAEYDGDLGFRVFKLSSSNIREWEPQPEDLDTALELSVENLKAGRTEHDILCELLLKRGIELTVPIESRDISGKTVHSIGAGTMFACLSERIERADAEPVALGIVAWRDELAPAGEIRVVFRDSAFVDDVAKTNLAEILRQHGLADVKSI